MITCTIFCKTSVNRKLTYLKVMIIQHFFVLCKNLFSNFLFLQLVDFYELCFYFGIILFNVFQKLDFVPDLKVSIKFVLRISNSCARTNFNALQKSLRQFFIRVNSCTSWHKNLFIRKLLSTLKSFFIVVYISLAWSSLHSNIYNLTPWKTEEIFA